MSHEITEKDEMFSVLVTPWHGLGTVLDEPPTIEEAIRAANLGWRVEAEPLFTAAGLEAPASGIVRQDTGDVLGVVGPRYEPLQNEEAFEVFQPLLETGDLALETAGSLKAGRRVWILAKILTTDPRDIGRGDAVEPYVLLSTAHDGTQAVRFGFTPVRVVCNNTLTMAEREGGSSHLIKIAHLKNVKESVLELTNIMDLQKAQFELTTEQYRQLARRSISASDLRRYVRLSLAPRTKTTEDGVDVEVAEDDLTGTERKVVRLFEEGRGADKAGKTYWGAYNAINEFLCYERGRGSQDDRLHSLWFAEARRIDQRALDAAIRMAA